MNRLVCVSVLIFLSCYLHACSQFESKGVIHQHNRVRRVPHKDYLRNLYAHFRQIFWNPSTTTRQFAVVTIEQLNILPTLPAVDFPLSNPYDYNAAFYDQTTPEHTEIALLYTLSTQIIQYLHDTNNLPANIYLYTYNIPCPYCTNKIVDFIEVSFPYFLENEIRLNPQYAHALQQISSMTYRIGWTLERVPQEAEVTLQQFADVDEDPQESSIKAYRRIRL